MQKNTQDGADSQDSAAAHEPQDIFASPTIARTTARIAYLQALLRQYGTLPLPLGAAHADVPLRAVFLPLKLRQEPLSAEDEEAEARRRRQRSRHAQDAFAPDERDASDEGHEHGGAVVLAEDGAEALAKSPARRMILLGSPGTGKTTLLKHLVCDAAQAALSDADAPLPLFVSLPDVARSGQSLEGYLDAMLAGLGVDAQFASELWRDVEEGRGFVCLDSLDEVVPASRGGMIGLINEMAPQYGGAWVVGSRFTEYKGGQFTPGSFVEWEVQPLDRANRLELARRLLPALARVLGREGATGTASATGVTPDAQDAHAPRLSPVAFISALEAQPALASWGENPLLFSLAAVVFARGGVLPQSRAALYAQVLDAVLATHETDAERQREMRSALAEAALRLYQTSGRTFQRDALLSAVQAAHDEVKHPAWQPEEMVGRVVASGVIEAVGQDSYSFRHQTFQEYLAALALAERLVREVEAGNDAAWAFAWGKRTYSRWTEILRLLVGILIGECGDEGVYIAGRWLNALIGLREQPEGDVGELGLALAVKSLSEMSDAALAEEIQQVASRVVDIWLDDVVEGLRREESKRFERLRQLAAAIGQLSRDATLRAIERLSAFLASAAERRWSGRCIAGKMLADIGTPEAIDSLISCTSHAVHEVRAVAMIALQPIARAVPAQVFLDGLNDKHSYIRVVAVGGLATLGDRVPIEPVLAALNDAEAGVRNQALETLGAWAVRGHLVSLDPIFAALDANSPQTRTGALRVLARLGERAPVDMIVARLHSDNRSTREAALWAMAVLGERATIEPILAIVQDKAEMTEQRARALVILGKLGKRVPADILIAALEDSEPKVRTEAATALGQLRVYDAREQLVRALGDRDTSVRMAAAGALCRIGEHALVEDRLLALAQQHTRVHEAATQILGFLGADAPLEPLLAALHHDEPPVRAGAAQALAQLGERMPIAEFITALHDTDAWVRASAIRALAQLGEQAPLDAILPLLHDADTNPRFATVHLLAALKQEAPVEPLIEALTDPASHIRGAAAEALAALGERAPVEVLLQAALAGGTTHSGGAVGGLCKVGVRERVPLEPLVQALSSPDERIRGAATHILGNLGDRAPIETIATMLEDEATYVRRAAVDALENMRDRAPVAAIHRMLSDPEQEVRHRAIRALAMIGDESGLQALMELAHSPEEWDRYSACSMLEQLHTPAAISLLIEALGDRSDIVSIHASWSLRELDEQHMLTAEHHALMVSPLLHALRHGGSSSRLAAANTLHTIGYTVPLEPLVAILENGVDIQDEDDDEVRRSVVGLLGELGERAPMDVLISALGDSDSDVRAAAAAALAKLPSAEARIPRGLVTMMLGDPAYGVGMEAANLVRQIAPDALRAAAVEAQAVLAGGECGDVLGSVARIELASLIGALERPTPRMLDMLTEMLDWPYAEVRKTAAEALGTIRRNVPDRAIRSLLALRRDPQSNAVRGAAEDALAEILTLETGIEDEAEETEAAGGE